MNVYFCLFVWKMNMCTQPKLGGNYQKEQNTFTPAARPIVQVTHTGKSLFSSYLCLRLKPRTSDLDCDLRILILDKDKFGRLLLTCFLRSCSSTFVGLENKTKTNQPLEHDVWFET